MARWDMKDVFNEEDIKDLSLELTRLGETGGMEGEYTVDGGQPEEEASVVSPDRTSGAQSDRSVLFIILAGVGTVIVLQVLIISIGLVILWEIKKRRQ